MGFVMSIDTGNKMMKTNHFIFHSGIKRKEQKILPGEEGIFLKGSTIWRVIREFPIWKIKQLMIGTIF